MTKRSLRKNPYARKHLRAAYRSGLEAAVAASLASSGIVFGYEAFKVPWVQPEKHRTYTPDIALPNGIVVELKGMFTLEDRQKHVQVKAQYPELDLRFVFSNSKGKLRKGSKTTYADWCANEGIPYAHKEIPEEWLKEKPNKASLRVLEELGWKPSSSTPKTNT